MQMMWLFVKAIQADQFFMLTQMEMRYWLEYILVPLALTNLATILGYLSNTV